MIRLYTLSTAPAMVHGLVRDIRVRWALEEAGLSYEIIPVAPEELNSPSYRKLQPFGQVPAYEEEGLTLFESGAIVHHIAERTETLMPMDPLARKRTLMWMFAAVNSAEPQMINLFGIDFFYANEDWAKARRPGVLDLVSSRVKSLAQYLEGKDYLEGSAFTAADLLMTTVLLIIRHTDLVQNEPALAAYLKRCTSRPAFLKANQDHLSFLQIHNK